MPIFSRLKFNENITQVVGSLFQHYSQVRKHFPEMTAPIYSKLPVFIQATSVFQLFLGQFFLVTVSCAILLRFAETKRNVEGELNFLSSYS